MPLIRETLDQLCNAFYFTKFDIITPFNKICMAAGEEWKITFRTHLGLYKYLVMPFRLANVPSFFQNFINNDLKNNILDLFVTAYVDNILVFSKTFHRHKKHVKTFLAWFQASGIQLDIDKYEFEVYETKYLGLIIQSTSPDSCPECVKMCPTKNNAIVFWKSP